MKLLDKPEYYSELYHQLQIAQTGSRVVIATMVIDVKISAVQQLGADLRKAAERGVEPVLMIDWFSYCHGLFFTISSWRWVKFNPFNRKLCRFLDDLQKSGVKVVVTNKPNRLISNKNGGRSHMKYAVFDDITIIGGCNLNTPESKDVMVKSSSLLLKEKLLDISNKITANPQTKQVISDQTIALDETTKLLIDAGNPGKSIILDTALKVLKNAQHQILVVNQMIPDGRLLVEIKSAVQRKVKIFAWITHPKLHTSTGRTYEYLKYFLIRQFLAKSTQTYWEKNKVRYVHAKIILADNILILGSNNYADLGVKFGTAEIALITTDKTLIKEVYDFTRAANFSNLSEYLA